MSIEVGLGHEHQPGSVADKPLRERSELRRDSRASPGRATLAIARVSAVGLEEEAYLHAVRGLVRETAQEAVARLLGEVRLKDIGRECRHALHGREIEPVRFGAVRWRAADRHAAERRTGLKGRLYGFEGVRKRGAARFPQRLFVHSGVGLDLREVPPQDDRACMQMIGQHGHGRLGARHGRGPFAGRRERNPCHLSEGTLVPGIERADGLDGRAEELEPERPFLGERPDVQDSAAHGSLAACLDLWTEAVPLRLE